MALDPRKLPAVGDAYGDGIVARAVATAEGVEITVREPVSNYDGFVDEDRPVSIPNKVDPSALDNEGEETAEEADKAEAEDRVAAEKDAAERAAKRAELKETGKAETKPATTARRPVGK